VMTDEFDEFVYRRSHSGNQTDCVGHEVGEDMQTPVLGVFRGGLQYPGRRGD
jgi:hypothetical protein